MSRRSIIMALLILILELAFALRLYNLADQSLWFDETATGVSLRDARLNPTLIEAHSAAYFVLVAPSYVVLPTDYGLRWPSIVAGILSIAVIYRLGRRIAGEPAGVIAAALLAISPYFIHYSREVRHYSLVALFTLLTLWLALRLKPQRGWADLLFAISAVFLTGLHVLSVFWLAPLIGMLALQRNITRRGASWLVLIATTTGIALMLIAIRSMGMAGRGYLEGLSWIGSLSMIQLPKKFLSQGVGIEWLSPLVKRIMAAVVIGAMILSAAITKRILPQVDRSVLLLLLVVSLSPIALVIAVSYVFMPLWVLRYLTPALTTYILLAAIILSSLRPRVLAASAATALIVSGMLSYIVYPEREVEDWRGVTAYLQTHLQDDDIVFACRSVSSVPLGYYMPELPIYHLPNTADLALSDSSAVMLKQIQPPIDAIPDHVRRVWIANRNGSTCTLPQYGVDPAGLEDDPAEVIGFTGVTLVLFERADQP